MKRNPLDPRSILLVAALLSVPLLYLSVSLFKHMSPELQELLPLNSKYLQDTKLAQGRFNAPNNLVLWIESASSEHAQQFQEQIANTIREANIPLVQSVEDRVGPEGQFFYERIGLFFTPQELDQLKVRFTQKKSGLFRIIGDLKDLVSIKKWNVKLNGFFNRYLRFREGTYGSPDGKIKIVHLKLTNHTGGIHLQTALSVQSAVAAIVQKTIVSFPDVSVRYTGNVRHLIEDHESVFSDMGFSTLLVLILVGSCLYFYFRSFRDLSYLFTSLAFGLLLCFGVAHFLFHPMNANAAFMTCIVIGNGINFGIILLTRIREQGNISSVVKDVRAPTLLAMGGGVIAYGSLAITDFRGFQQFGLMGAVGMVCCWISAMLIIPNLVRVFEGDNIYVWPKPIQKQSLVNLEKLKKPMQYGLGVILVAITIALVVPSIKFQYETDLFKLRDEKSLKNGSMGLAKRLEVIMGQQLAPLVVLTSTREHATQIAQKIQSTNIVPSIISIDQLVPKNQPERILAIKKFIRETEAVDLATLKPLDRGILQAIRQSKNVKAFEEKDIPENVLKYFEELNGERGRIIYLETKSAQQNDLGEVRKLLQTIQQVTKEVDPNSVLVGTHQMSVELCDAVEKESQKITLIVFFAILALVVILYPQLRSSTWILTSWGVALLSFAAIILFGKIKLNMINFLAIPITVGIGIDYAANFFSRLKSEPFGVAFRAVALCSAATCLGYLSLLSAGNRGLQSFAILAFVGEIVCLFFCAYWGVIFSKRQN